VHNAAIAAVAAHALGASPDDILQGLLIYQAAPMRLEVHTSPRHITLLNDAYSSDPTTARAALQALAHHPTSGRRIAVLGEMLELGARSQLEHEALGQAVADARIDLLVCVGSEAARAIARAASAAGLDREAIRHVEHLDALHALMSTLLHPQDVVLFKASRAVGLERAAARILDSVGPTRLKIDLDAIRDNYHALRRHVGAGLDVMPVVKSFAYGSDSTRVASLLLQEGAPILAVAYPDEGVELRAIGLNAPILVLNTLVDELDKIFHYDLTPVVYSRHVIDALCALSVERSAPIPVHLKIDTGMHRVGVSHAEAVELAQYIVAQPQLVLQGLMTHLASADDAAQDAFSTLQLERFEQVVAALHALDIHPSMLHASNTAASARRLRERVAPRERRDLVRVGLGLYGLHPSPDVALDSPTLRPALEFVTKIIHLQNIEDGETVGYNRSWRASGTRRVATIAVGYNDGLPRFMSNGGHVLVHGQRCPIVGLVCMDATMIDVTDVPRAALGDEVILFNEVLPIEEIARRGATISYELLCNISPRVRRIFTRGG
jgi:alanine racemase